jgi:predicted ATPase
VPVRRLTVDRGQARLDRWPYTMAVVAQILDEGLDLSPGVTILIGQNGSGKSTVVEALAAAWGRRIGAFRSDWVQKAAAQPSAEDSDLNESLRLQYTRGGPNGGLFLRAERLHAQADWFSAGGRWSQRMGGVNVLARSHGEGFLEILAAMVAEPGLYILDEPESALSFDSCLILLTLMTDMVAAGSQIVLATHSPVLAALPGAHLLQLATDGIHPVAYDDTDLVVSWRAFLAAPDRYLRHLG